MKLFIAFLVAIFPFTAFADPTTEEAQRLLNQLGLDAGAVDGSWGPKTATAMRRFYNELGLEFDGQLDGEEIDDLVAAAAQYRNFGNQDWSPEIRSELHDFPAISAPFSYINSDLISALTQFQSDGLPDLGMHPVGDPPNVRWVRRPMDADCSDVLKNMQPPDMARWDAPLYAQNCNYHYRRQLFSTGVEELQSIFDFWAGQPQGTFDLQPNGDDEYFKSSLMAQLGTTYALFYESFTNNQAIDRFFTDWMLNNQTLVGLDTCPFTTPSTFSHDRYKVDACGSNHWRLSVANYALGLRLGSHDLLITGAKHLEINLSMYDPDGVFTPYATRGWDAPGYAIDNNEYITSIALMLSEVGINLYDIKIYDGRTVRDLIDGHNAWLTDPSGVIEKYVLGTRTCNSGSCTVVNSIEDLGSIDQWRIDRQFQQSDIFLRSFHYQVAENRSDDILEAEISSSIGPISQLPDMYVWGQTSGVPFIFATLEQMGYLASLVTAPNQATIPTIEATIPDFSAYSPDDGQWVCAVDIRRTLSGETSEENSIGTGKIKSEAGRIDLPILNMRTGGGLDASIISESAELQLAETGEIYGQISMFTMFGNEQIDTVILGSEFVPAEGRTGPEGVHAYTVRDGLTISFLVSDCN